MMEDLEEAELCFPQLNTSCRKKMHPNSEIMLTYTMLPCITVLTVVLNLLVIISISHFRQLHTPTNLLLLSLAVADFIVGFLLMPILPLQTQPCWILGDYICVMHYFIGFLIVCVSVGNMVLIAVDRYIAICDPMFYTTKVTLKRVQLFVCLCWLFSAVHSTWIMRDVLKQPGRYKSCYGECVVVLSFAEELLDGIVSFFAPIIVIILLYMRVFVVAVSQARAMRSHVTAFTLQHSQTVKAKKSEMKAARTLGIVILVFVLCCSPYYCFNITVYMDKAALPRVGVTITFLYFNSCLNPVIYAFFYPWFRKAIKYIVTLQILQPGSSEASLM